MYGAFLRPPANNDTIRGMVFSESNNMTPTILEIHAKCACSADTLAFVVHINEIIEYLEGEETELAKNLLTPPFIQKKMK